MWSFCLIDESRSRGGCSRGASNSSSLIHMANGHVNQSTSPSTTGAQVMTCWFSLTCWTISDGFLQRGLSYNLPHHGHVDQEFRLDSAACSGMAVFNGFTAAASHRAVVGVTGIVDACSLGFSIIFLWRLFCLLSF